MVRPLLLTTSALAAGPSAAAAPRVIFTVIVDDLGWNNVGWHINQTDPHGRLSGVGPESATPHLNALAYEGIRLNRHYTHFTCTPSRSTYMTGRLPMHVQQTLANPDVQTAGIPRNMTALPAKLSEAGWKTHVVGKWDLGMATPDHTPEGRGFNSSLIYFEHMNYYWTQQICVTGTSCNMNTFDWLVDLWDTGKGAAMNGTAYIETLFAERLNSIVSNHDLDRDGPLYLHYTPHVAHWPLQVPEAWYNKFSNVTDDEDACKDDIPHVWPGANASVVSCRRQYVSMVAMVDEIVGNITSMMKAKGWWDETLMIFSADNGGSIATSENAASNYPLRGGKYQPMEGGIRVAAFVSGGYLPPAVQGTQLDAPVHMADWYGTICNLTGIDPFDHKADSSVPRLPPVDSVNVWPLLSGANATSPRNEWPVSEKVIIQFEQAAEGDSKALALPGSPVGSGAVTHGWKLYTGDLQQGAGWMGPVYPNSSSPANDPYSVGLTCGPDGCLFDVVADPTEHVDLAASMPAKVAELKARLAQYASSFYSNSDVGRPICPPSWTGDCACWAAANVWGGYLGPWQY